MAASAQTALGADAFHGTLTVTGNQTDPNAVIPGTEVRLTATDNPQGYNVRIPGQYVAGTSITLCQLNWSATGGGFDLTTGSPWTWDDSLLAGFTALYDDVTSGNERIFSRRAFHMVQVEELPKPMSPVGIEATQFTLGTLSFAAPSYGATNTYTISLGSGSDEGTATVLGDGERYIYQGNGGLTLPAAYQFTVIPGGAWRATADDRWENGANWSGGGVPDANYTALVDIVSPVPSTLTLYKAESVKALRLETAGAGVTIGTNGGDWRLSVGNGGIKSTGAGNNTINAGVTLLANASVNVGTGNTLAIPAGADIGGRIMTKEGPGTLVLGAQTHTAASTLNVNQGTVKFDGNQRLSTLNVNAGVAQLTLGGAKVLVVDNSLTLGPAAKLDLTDNDMIVFYTGGEKGQPSPTLLSIREQIRTAYGANGRWQGYGIKSSEAAKDRFVKGVAYAQNDMLFVHYHTFDGVNVNPHSPWNLKCVLVKYTYLGDINLDGVVDDIDVTILGMWYNATATNKFWTDGDVYGYDGMVFDGDVDAIGLNYGAGVPPGEPLPEPATLALVGLGALALLRRRRR